MPRILLVDDEPLISMLLEGWLNELGCEVVGPAGSLEKGLALAGSAEIDGAILDIHLKGQESYSVANALKSRGIPFAFSTGTGSIDPASGFANPILLNKPFDFDGVKAVLGKLLKQAA
ncbi:MAG TPA: response regulator [Methyloceanibacter sp.]|nr:response regulator [Methyloceanibacter sp.]